MNYRLTLFAAAVITTAFLAPTARAASPAAAEKPRVLLPVPMVFQAPFSVWDKVHDDTCEEASLLMVRGWAEGRKEYTRQEMEDGLQKAVAWQRENYGFFESTDAELTARMAREHFGLELEIVPVKTAADIRALLDKGKPVIIPAAGRLLNNPYFKNGGPHYHMLVVRGYTANYFITGEPGTRHGQDYRYAQWRLALAVHDWHARDTMRYGRKVVLVPML